VPFAANVPNEEFSGSHTAIGTHSRFTRQFLGYAQRERLARTLFYDFPVTPLNEMLFGTERAASMEAALSVFDGQSLAS
jgi:hypothetical protein